MTASVFTVSHSLVGWLVSEGDCIAEVFSSRFWAQKGAEALAYERYAGTGQPAMVVLTYPPVGRHTSRIASNSSARERRLGAASLRPAAALRALCDR